MKTRRSLFLLITFATIGVTVNAQHQLVDTLVRRFDSYRKNHFQEKIYLHTDQSTYLTGEIIWFSTYLVDGSFHQFSDLSKVAYIEIIDKYDKPVVQSKVEINKGKGNGSLYLQPAISSGNYFIRAYTRWMENSSPEFFFQKQITIINTFEPLEETKKSSSVTTYDAQFFPEGGHLLAGVSNTIGFRVIDGEGKGVKFKGALLNSNNDTLLHFAPTRFGIGKFAFHPQANATYRAVLKDDQGHVQSVALPEIMSEGYALNVVDTLDQLVVRIQSISANANAVPVYFFVHARQQITHADMKFASALPTIFKINKKELAEGISHITLFDQNLAPVAERLVFRQPTKKLSISSGSDQKEYGIRRPVNLTIATVAGSPAANLSVAVFKSDSLSNASAGSILDYLWLSSDLKGTIESPEYYLSQDSPEVREAIDNLMITHGWRKFDWKKILAREQSPVKFIPEIYGHVVTAHLVNSEGTPAPGIMTYLSSPSRTAQVYVARSNAAGKMQYVMTKFYGSRRLIAHTNYKSADSVYRINIDDPFSVDYATSKLRPFKLSPTLGAQLLSRSMSMQVGDVFHREQQERFTNLVKDTVAFYGKADEAYKLDDFTRFPVMEEVMREYVPGVLVRKRKDGFHFIVMDDVNRSVFSSSEPPFMMIDGVTFFDEDEIMSFDPLRVKTLDVMRRKYFFGTQTFNGVVSYTTYTGDLAGFPLNPHSVVIDYEGLQQQREFYSPRYENQKQRESRLPDQRYLLYWNGSITTDAQGKSQVTFYTSDVAGSYRVVIEGMNGEGAAGSTTTSFDVKAFNN